MEIKPLFYRYDKNTRKRRLTEMKRYANEISSHVGENSNILEVVLDPVIYR